MINLPKTTIIYGPTGVAKSSFVINYSVANNNGCAILFLTSEMSPKDITDRLSIITNDLSSDAYTNASQNDKIAFNNINTSKTSHITILNNREGLISLESLKDEIDRIKLSGIERVVVVIDSFNIWADSIKQTEDEIISKLMEIQEETSVEYLLVVQEHRITNSIKHFADQVIKFTYERGGKTINGKKTLKMYTEKSRYGDTMTMLVPFSGTHQKFYF